MATRQVLITGAGGFIGSHLVDLLVNEVLVFEVKAVDALAPVHSAQVLTYLKLTEKRLGLLINFNVPLLRQGIKRIIL